MINLSYLITMAVLTATALSSENMTAAEKVKVNLTNSRSLSSENKYDHEAEDYSYTDDNYGRIEVGMRMSGGRVSNKKILDTFVFAYNKAVKTAGLKQLIVQYNCKKSLLSKRSKVEQKTQTLDNFLKGLAKNINVTISRVGNKITISDKKK